MVSAALRQNNPKWKEKQPSNELAQFVINNMIRTVLNMVPNFVIVNPQEDLNHNKLSILQPLELLSGKSLCQELLNDPSEINKKFQLNEDLMKPTLILDFLTEKSRIDDITSLNGENLVMPDENFTYDLQMMNPLIMCFEEGNTIVASAEILIEYLVQ